jgi:hypothetical protein
MVQEYDGAPITRQLLVKKAFQQGIDWNEEIKKLEVIPPPGLPDIKWNELYYKWGRFVPEDRKQGLVYFHKAPPEAVKRKIASQSAMAKQVREKRSRTTDHEKKKPKTTSKN